MTIAYCHSPRLIHGLVNVIAPLVAMDLERDTWTIKVSGLLDKSQLDEVTARLLERLNENEALRA